VLYVPNRCILCTRCVRFMDDVAGAAVLNVSERGDRAYIGIAEEQLLDHPWAGNVVDLCPVGSLLSKDFLHKARAWDLDKTASICPGCTQGCSISIDTRDDVVVRFRPRPNLEVNRHFMCDTGRQGYRWLNRGDRVEAPLVREGARLVATDWDRALDRLGVLLEKTTGSVVLLASGRLSTESLGLARQLVAGRDVAAAIHVPMGDAQPLAGIPNLALRRERVPNLKGAELTGYVAGFERAFAAIPRAALVIVLDADLTPEEEARLAAAGAEVVWMGTVATDAQHHAQLVLPLTTMAEENGTYVNRDGRVQVFQQAKGAPGMARPAWWVAGEVLAGPGPDRDAPGTGAEAFAALGQYYPAFAGLSHADLGFTGLVLPPRLAEATR
jgi:NADH-quinone oxidoreductase subunit G